MQYKYEPKICRDSKDWSGHIVLKGLHYEKKLELMETLEEKGVKLADLASMGDELAKDPLAAMRLINSFITETKHLWISCEIKDTKENVTLKSFDDVAEYPKAHPMLQEVAMHIVAGGLGN